jgi:hypothetical protein
VARGWFPSRLVTDRNKHKSFMDFASCGRFSEMAMPGTADRIARVSPPFS